MSSARTQVSYLVPTASSTTATSTAKKKLHRDRDKGGNVLNNPSPYNPVYDIVGQSSGGISPSILSGRHSTRSSMSRETTLNSSNHSHLPPRLSATIANVKERRHGRHPEDVSKRHMVMDEDGVAHDSEYKQFRTATPVHLHRQNSARSAPPIDDDGSASSSSASSRSDESRFSSSPYTYTSTHRTTPSTYTPGLGTSSASAVPNRLLNKTGRGERIDPISSSYSIPPAPSSSLRHADYDSRLPSSSKYRSALQPPSSSSYQIQSSSSHQHRPTTSSFQPPAPFSSRLGDPSVSLRLPPRLPSSNSSSLAGATARMSLADQDAGMDEYGGSGYNQFASNRPPQMDGTALDAGVHGMKRSWDGFKLEMKFGARRAKKSVERKILNL